MPLKNEESKFFSEVLHHHCDLISILRNISMHVFPHCLHNTYLFVYQHLPSPLISMVECWGTQKDDEVKFLSDLCLEIFRLQSLKSRL